MVKEIQYTTVQRVLENLMEHPLLSNITLEQVVKWTVRFIGLHGFSKFYQDKETDVEIHEFRGTLPCDCISITQVMDCKTHRCLRSMTSNFMPDEPRLNGQLGTPNSPTSHAYFPYEELSFKTQGQIIYTSFPEGEVRIAYKSIPVDDNGFPMLIDNETYLAALEAYIKKQVFTVKFDTGKIPASVLQNAQMEYGYLSAQLASEFTTPSLSEMESISRMMTTMIRNPKHFDNGFKNLGNREYLRKQ